MNKKDNNNGNNDTTNDINRTENNDNDNNNNDDDDNGNDYNNNNINSIDDEEKELCRRGIQTLMGTTMMNTNTHVVSAPMATYLVRNGSRFEYANEFQYISVKSFLSGCLNDIILTSNYKGFTFLKSLVANYLCRSLELEEDTSVFDFFSKYSTTKGKKTTKKPMQLQENHPSFKHLLLVKSGTPVIPVINYYDFSDTQKIGGTCIDDDDAIELLHENDPALQHMDLYAKVSVILCCPFVALKDIQDTDGNFLPYFSQFMREGRLKWEHQTYLFNAQDCRNRFNSMRPKDSLETTT